ncbi:Ger(x)C family spore germination protein [Bacillus salipaludis]|nr:Ger(x)C family spore germination protein [Bacillus salipaludis]MDQ6598154.1 Ger(x)C family spore germination protein [Bacillus salipaludis]
MNSQKRKNIRYFCALLPLILIIPGCSFPRQKIIDDVQLPKVLGFDKVDNQYVGTALYSDYTGDEKEGGSSILQGKGRKSHLIKQSINAQSPKPLEIGKLNLVIFGKELAENGVSYFVKTVCRDPLIGSNMLVAVSEETAEEILMKNKDRNSNYPYKMIEQNYRTQNVPIPTLQSFLFDFYGDGRDPSLPYLKINQKGNIEVNGLAVLKKDRLGLILNQKESFLYKILRGRVIRGQTEFNIHKGQSEDSVILAILYGKNKKSIINKGSKSKVTFNITLNGMVKDFPDWLDLRKKQNNLLLKKQLEKQMKKDFEKLFVKFQMHQVDPLGIGDFARANSKKWNEKEFYEKVYPTISLDINLKIELSQAGIGE